MLDDASFRSFVLRYWRAHGRHDLPWRHTEDAYRILVSEVMLQQTQVPRVVDLYSKFLRAFPSFRVLARATPASVLKAWQGLGYNRRALMLLRCAKMVMTDFGGAMPRDYEALQTLPGVGPYTAGAVMAFAFDRGVPLIETNIRRIYIHHFFQGRRDISDAEILPIVARHVSQTKSARRWYSALMDYGTWLATQTDNPNIRSKHYTRQSIFEGSHRQIRGAVVRSLIGGAQKHSTALAKSIGRPATQVAPIMAQLEKEGFVTRCRHARCVHNPHWSLA